MKDEILICKEDAKIEEVKIRQYAENSEDYQRWRKKWGSGVVCVWGQTKGVIFQIRTFKPITEQTAPKNMMAEVYLSARELQQMLTFAKKYEENIEKEGQIERILQTLENLNYSAEQVAKVEQILKERLSEGYVFMKRLEKHE